MIKTPAAGAHPGWVRVCPSSWGSVVSLADLAADTARVGGAGGGTGGGTDLGTVLAVFVPFAFTPTCQAELEELQDARELLVAAGVTVVAVSCDSKFTLAAWTDSVGFGWPVLSDFWPHGALSRDFGVFDERSGMAVRGTFLLDSSGRVLGSEVKAPGERRDFSVAGLARWLEVARRAV